MCSAILEVERQQFLFSALPLVMLITAARRFCECWNYSHLSYLRVQRLYGLVHGVRRPA